MTETVLVTGGTGFVGGWCIVELLKCGYNVRTTVRDLSKAPIVRTMVAEANPGDRLGFAVADLTEDDGWPEAVSGCDYVLHVASPLGLGKQTPDELIATARDGALRVLRAAVKAGVKRVVLTSSTAACDPPHTVKEAVSDESVWTDPNDAKLTAYRRSKTIAEKAAWDFMAANGSKTEFVTILPTAIIGPILTTDGSGSVQIVQRLLNGALPGIPNFGFNTVDVRDVAVMHIRAMIVPEAAGHRFIAGSGWTWMADIAKTLRERLEKANKVPTRRLPDFLLRMLSLFQPEVREVTILLGRRHDVTSAKAQKMLGWKPRPPETAVIDCAESLIARGAV